MKRVSGTWTGDERVIPGLGRFTNNLGVSLPEDKAKSFEEQGLFVPDKPKVIKKEVQKDVRSNN